MLSCALSRREKVAGVCVRARTRAHTCVRACACGKYISLNKQCLCAVLFVKCVSEKNVVECCVKNTPLR